MRIDFTRSGGFAGIMLTAAIDTATMPAEEARQLEEMVAATDFFKLPAASPPARGADRFQYTVAVDKDGSQHTVRIAETQIPESLRPLLDYLMKAARTRGHS